MLWFSLRFGIQLIPQKLAQYVFYIKTCKMNSVLCKLLYKPSKPLPVKMLQRVLRSWVDILWKVIQEYILCLFLETDKDVIRN